MSTNTSEFIIKQDGSAVLRQITEIELDVQQSVFDRMAEGTPRVLKAIFHMEEWGIAHASVLPGTTYLTVPLTKLPLRAPFKLVGDKKAGQILVPVFSSKTDPIFSMMWEPPEEMRLFLLVSIRWMAKGNGGYWEASGAWLFAMSKDGNFWRLPLPNIHDNCGVCEGEWERDSESLRGALRAALDQFQKSAWNADLWKDPESTQRMFRFKPKKDGFEVLPIDGEKDWTKMCLKVAVDVTKHLIV